MPLLTLLHNEFKSDLVNVESGDLFIIYSDGIIETTNKKGEEFGLERFKQIILNSYSLSTAQISEEVYRKLNAHGSSHDDQSLIIIRRK